MITAKNVLDSISERLISVFPLDNHVPYRDEVPQNFLRPCSLISCTDVEMEQSDAHSVFLTFTVVIRGFVAVDSYHNSDSGELYSRGMLQSGIFSSGYLTVSDSDTEPETRRALHVVSNHQNFGADFVDTTIAMTLTVSKSDFTAAQQPQPIMSHLAMRRVLKEV